MKASRPSRRGMTLMELLIVMVIIGVLVALLLPATAKMRNRATAAKEKALRVTLVNAVLNYHAEYGKWPVASQPGSGSKEYNSSDVIPQLRSYGNERQKNFWEGDDRVLRSGGPSEYKVRINPQGRYPIGEVDETSSTYTVSVF
jgi:prepilin-type N-terminal cleavage/methylation domain-containing protein